MASRSNKSSSVALRGVSAALRVNPSCTRTHLRNVCPTIAEPLVAISDRGVIARTASEAWRDDAIQARRTVLPAWIATPPIGGSR